MGDPPDGTEGGVTLEIQATVSPVVKLFRSASRRPERAGRPFHPFQRQPLNAVSSRAVSRCAQRGQDVFYRLYFEGGLAPDCGFGLVPGASPPAGFDPILAMRSMNAPKASSTKPHQRLTLMSRERLYMSAFE